MNNPFVAYAAKHGLRRFKPRLARSDADAPMKATAQEKEQRDKQAQLRLYREYRREELVVARGGQWGDDIIALEKFLRRMTIDDTEALIDHVKRSTLLRADLWTRAIALRLISDGIAHLRAVNGYAPFDDSLPDEEPTVFEIIRMELGVP